MKKHTARNWYRWLWLSPLIIVPSLILSMLFTGFIYDPGRDLICEGSWRNCDHRMMADLVNILFIAFASTFWHLILLKPALDKKSAFVRWHGRQALLLGGLQATALLVSVPILDYESVRPGLVLVLIAIWFFSTRWGQSQAARGDCSLMRWFEQTEALPTRKPVLKSKPVQVTKPDPESLVNAVRYSNNSEQRNKALRELEKLGMLEAL